MADTHAPTSARGVATTTLDKTFAATLVKSPAKGGWAYVVTDWAAEFFGTDHPTRDRPFREPDDRPLASDPSCMISYLTTDVNCPTCFNELIDAISASPGVRHVEAHVADGCIAVTHGTDETQLLDAIATIGQTLDIADNGEIVMGQAHGLTVSACEHH